MDLCAPGVLPFCLLARMCPDISLAKEFSQSSGRPAKTVWHLGQLMARPSPHCEVIQVKQKLWPQGMETGSEKTSWQMKHWNCASDSRTLGEAMACKCKKNTGKNIVNKSKRLIYLLYISESLTIGIGNNKSCQRHLRKTKPPYH